MKWQRKPPDRAGYWLRFNAGHRVQLHRVWEEPGRGTITVWGFSSGEGAPTNVALDYPKLRGWLWFGPIPEPPDVEPYEPEGDEGGEGDGGDA